MNALISGQAGIAFLIEGNTIGMLDVDAPTTIVPSSPSAIPFALGNSTDVVQLEGVSQAAVVARLQSSWRFDRSLSALLTLLEIADSEKQDDDLKDLVPELASAAGELLAVDDTKAAVLDSMFAVPLPKSNPIRRLRQLVKLDGGTEEILAEIESFQSEIQLLGDRWDAIDKDLFEPPEAFWKMRVDMVHRGTWRQLAKSMNDPATFGICLIDILQNLRSYKNSRSIIDNWIREIKPIRTTILHLAAEYGTQERKEVEGKSQGKRSKKMEGHVAFEKVSTQIDSIGELIKSGNTRGARSQIEDLIRFQMQTGELIHISKSLCSLAQTAKEFRNFSLQLELAQRATELSPTDGWAHAQVGDAFIQLNQFDNAVRAFDQSVIFDQSAFAKTAQARLLQLKGKLDDALRAYEELLSDDADSQVLVGLAEVYRDRRELQNAKATYELAVEKFPDSPVPLTGLANVLLELGELDNAEKLFREGIDRFPVTYTYCGLANTLKEKGELVQALEAYKVAIDKLPGEYVPLCGYAETLKALGRYSEAREAYQRVTEEYPFLPVPANGLANTYLDQGDVETALHKFQEYSDRFPYDTWSLNGKANALRRIGRWDESLRVYDTTIQNFPYDYVARHGRAIVLKESGNLEDALTALRDLEPRSPRKLFVQNSIASIMIARGELAEASKLVFDGTPKTYDEWISFHISSMILLKSGDLNAAIHRLRHGVNSIEFASQREVFSNSLAIALLRTNDLKDAAQQLVRSRGTFADVIRIHAYGEAGNVPAAAQAFQSANEPSCPPLVVQLRNELAARYRLVDKKPAFDLNWVLSTELDCAVLLAA